MTSETEELLEALKSAGFVEKRTVNGVNEWKITTKGMLASKRDLEAVEYMIANKGKQP